MSGLRAAVVAPFEALDRYAQRSVDWFMFAVMRTTGRSKPAIRLAAAAVEVVCLVEMMLDHWRNGRRQVAVFYAIAAAIIGALSFAMNGLEEKLISLGGDSTGSSTRCFRWLWWFFLATNVIENAGVIPGHADAWDFIWDAANLFRIYSAGTPPKAPDKQPRRVLVPVRSSS